MVFALTFGTTIQVLPGAIAKKFNAPDKSSRREKLYSYLEDSTMRSADE